MATSIADMTAYIHLQRDFQGQEYLQLFFPSDSHPDFFQVRKDKWILNWFAI